MNNVECGCTGEKIVSWYVNKERWIMTHTEEQGGISWQRYNSRVDTALSIRKSRYNFLYPHAGIWFFWPAHRHTIIFIFVLRYNIVLFRHWNVHTQNKNRPMKYMWLMFATLRLQQKSKLPKNYHLRSESILKRRKWC